MEPPQQTQSARPLVGFILLTALFATCAGGKAVLYDTLDPDCFWHLRVADQLHRDGVGPLVDELSFASSRQPWTPYSWLGELGMKSLWDMGGYRAAVAAQALMQAAIVALLAMCCLEMQRQSRDNAQRRYLVAAVATVAGAFMAMPYLSFRPVTAALVLLSVCAWLILRDRRLAERSRALWIIVPMTALLTNVHLFAFFIPATVLALLAGALLERRRAHFSEDLRSSQAVLTEVSTPLGAYFSTGEKSRRVRRYSLLLLCTAIACLATPMLPGVLRTALFYSSSDVMVHSNVIQEMQFFAKGPFGLVSGAIAVTIASCAIWRRRRLRVAEALCLVAAAILLLTLGRFAPVFAIIACPVLAVTLPDLKDRLLAQPAIWATLAVVLFVGASRLVGAFPSKHQPLSAWLNRHGPDAPGYPCAAADYVAGNVDPSSRKILNEFSWGGYLSWRLGDDFQVLLDGRTQVYPAAFWRALYLNGDTAREGFLANVRADAAVLPVARSDFRLALLKLGWTSAYRDDRAEVMLPPAALAHVEP